MARSTWCKWFSGETYEYFDDVFGGQDALLFLGVVFSFFACRICASKSGADIISLQPYIFP
jgi:hypothetical protein